MVYRILKMFSYLVFSWAFFVSALWMELPVEHPYTVVAATILFIKLIFMGSAVLYSVVAFSKLWETGEPE